MAMRDPFPLKHICTCMCHKKGVDMLHCVACCPLCYAKYLNEDGSVDIEAYGKAVRENLQYKEPDNEKTPKT